MLEQSFIYNTLSVSSYLTKAKYHYRIFFLSQQMKFNVSQTPIMPSFFKGQLNIHFAFMTSPRSDSTRWELLLRGLHHHCRVGEWLFCCVNESGCIRLENRKWKNCRHPVHPGSHRFQTRFLLACCASVSSSRQLYFLSRDVNLFNKPTFSCTTSQRPTGNPSPAKRASSLPAVYVPLLCLFRSGLVRFWTQPLIITNPIVSRLFSPWWPVTNI